MRPTENAGSSDVWRYELDREAGELSEEGQRDMATRLRVYLEAVHDWARRGSDSPHVLSAQQAAAQLREPAADEARAGACFRLATHLLGQGERSRARHWLAEAAALAPRSWRIRRELWTLDDPGNLAAGDFWHEVEALGDELYYEPPAIGGMPAQVTGG